jgi:hypothetical protein
LSEAERAMAEDIRANSIGRLDDEIVITRILLNRIIDLHKDIHDAPGDPKNNAGFVLSEITRSSKAGGTKADTTAVSKRPDTYAMMDRYLGRIAMLEKNRADLIAAAAASAEQGDIVKDQARRIKAALDAIEGAIVDGGGAHP